MNNAAVDATVANLVEIKYPAAWAQAGERARRGKQEPEWVRDVMRPILAQQGDKLPVSALHAGRHLPGGHHPVREARRRHQRAGVDHGELHPVQPVRHGLPARDASGRSW